MKRLALKTLIAALFIAGFGLACQVASAQGEKPKAVDSILGVRVGAKIEEAHEKLKDLGTWDGRATSETVAFRRVQRAEMVRSFIERNLAAPFDWISAVC